MLDVMFGEDQSSARTSHAVANLSLLRRQANNLLRRDQTQHRGTKGRQLTAALKPDNLPKFLKATESI